MCLGEMTTIVAIDPASTTATIDAAGRQRRVSLALMPDLPVGARVVVHTGFVVEVVASGTRDDPAAPGPDAPDLHGR